MMKKRFAAAGLAALLAVSALAGCGSTGTKTEETKAASDAATIKIGGMGPTTGNLAIYGNAVKNGMQIAIDEINAEGGINGIQIETQFGDDEGDPEKAVNAYNSLKDWGMQLLVGTTTSGACEAVVTESNASEMFQITPSATSLKSVAGQDNAFRMCFSDPAQGTVAAQYIASHNMATDIAVIYDSSDTYSTGIYENFVKEAAVQGLNIVEAQSFTSESNKDFSVQLQKAQAANAEMVFLPMYYTEASLILAKAEEMGFAPIFFGCDGMDGILTLENFDVALAEDLVLLTPFSADATDDLTKNFVATYQEDYEVIPNQFAADAYDAVYVIKAAAEKAGVTADMSVAEINDAMKTAMTEIEYTGLTGKNITWGEDGEPTKEPIAVQIQDGAYVFLD